MTRCRGSPSLTPETRKKRCEPGGGGQVPGPAGSLAASLPRDSSGPALESSASPGMGLTGTPDLHRQLSHTKALLVLLRVGLPNSPSVH